MNQIDRKIMERAARGESDAWRVLVQECAPYVQALVRSARVPEDDRSDAMQYVFVELFRALPSLREEGALRPWLRQTTLRHAIRLRNKLQREAPTIDESALESQVAEVALEEEFLRAEEAETVRQAVRALSTRCRELVSALFYEDPPRPYADLAQQMGLKIGSLAMTRQRCLEALERTLRAWGVGPP